MTRSETALTPVQRLVLELLSQGLRQYEVAHRVGITPSQVSRHATLAAQRMGCGTITQATVHWVKARVLWDLADRIAQTLPEEADRLRKEAGRLIP